MTADISHVVNVTLLPEGRLAGRDNANVVAIITDEQGGPLSTADRYALYSSLPAVAADWGTLSPVYQHAAVLFGTTPNPTNAGGVLVVGYWRAATETVAATAARLTGAQLSPASVLGQLQTIADGSLSLTIDGDPVALTALDFTSAVDLADVVAVLADALDEDGTATLDSNRIVITSPTTGATSTITLAANGATGTGLASVLALGAGTGAVTVQGAAAASLTAETKLDAVNALRALVNIKGAMFLDQPTDAEVTELSTWAQATGVLLYDVFSDPDNLEVAPANVVWQVRLAGRTNYRMLYSKAGNRLFATAYMARVHTVNFNAENTAMTMQLKELPIVPEDYSEGEIAGAKRVGLDIYTTIKETPVVLTSGANDFVDNPYNLIAYIDAVQTDMFNLLKGTATKIPQTQSGMDQMVDAAEKTTRGFVRSRVFAPGTWSSPDTFGDLETFLRNIATEGFYVMINSLADQPQIDREARIAPPLQIAVKNAGAVHHADIIINFNR